MFKVCVSAGLRNLAKESCDAIILIYCKASHSLTVASPSHFCLFICVLFICMLFNVFLYFSLLSAITLIFSYYAKCLSIKKSTIEIKKCIIIIVIIKRLCVGAGLVKGVLSGFLDV